jgi:hypothetical protein
VQKATYALRNARGKVCAVAVYGPPPSPDMARSLVGREHAPLVIWQARLIGAGCSAADLDRLQDYARHDLSTRLGYRYIYTMTENQAYMVDGLVGRACAALEVRAYAGWQYARTGWLYLGTTTPRGTAGYAIDGRVHHARQGKHTLSPATLTLLHPNARTARRLAATPKARWVDVLAATAEERTFLVSLLRYPPRAFAPLVQHRLLVTWRGTRPRKEFLCPLPHSM